MFLDIPSVLPFGLCLYLAWIIARSLGLSLCLALWILFAVVATHACPWIILCPVFVIPVCHCPTLPVLTMYYNKSLQMDPHVSRLVSSVTEYSAQPGSSSLSNGHSSSMGTNRILCALRQGPRSLENHIREFLVFTHYSDLPDIILIEIFCNGINQPLQSQQTRGARGHH